MSFLSIPGTAKETSKVLPLSFMFTAGTLAISSEPEAWSSIFLPKNFSTTFGNFGLMFFVHLIKSISANF